MHYAAHLTLIEKSIDRHKSDLTNRRSLVQGYETLRKVIRFCFSRFHEPSFFQRAVLRCDFRANLPLCFAHDVWNTCGSEILTSLGLSYVKNSVMITAPRRFGKTKARSLVAAADMIYCHNPISPVQMMICYVFSQTMDSSERFLLETGNWLKDYMKSVGDSCEYAIDVGVRKITVISKIDRTRGAIMHAAPGHGEVSEHTRFYCVFIHVLRAPGDGDGDVVNSENCNGCNEWKQLGTYIFMRVYMRVCVHGYARASVCGPSAPVTGHSSSGSRRLLR